VGTRADHVPELDGLRALACVAVVAWHCNQGWASGGSLGVDVFFVLSGWLITGILAREVERSGKIDVRGFLARRALRLVPALMAMLVAVVVIWPSMWPDALASGSYLINWFLLFKPFDSPLTPTWSLAVEMQFYLLWPFILPFLLRMPKKRAVIVLLVVWETMALVRTGTALASRSGIIAYYLPVFRFTGLLLGAWFALYPPKLKLGGIALLLLAACLGAAGTLHHFGRFLTFVPAIEILTGLVVIDPPRLLAWSPLPQLGRISYGVYLWHYPLCHLLPNRPFLPVLAGSIVLAVLSWTLIERPFVRRRSARGGLLGNPGGPVTQSMGHRARAGSATGQGPMPSR
jgi:peptidoglycan/LPS O-acetylase OafA/YrhL